MSPPPRAALGSTASDRFDDVVVAGAAAEVALEPLAHRLHVGVGLLLEEADTIAITMPGVQNPHCSPWCCWNAV